MKKLVFIIISVVLIFSKTEIFAKDLISIDKLPPVVVKTVPESGTMNVDPSTTAIKVTFSKDMQTKDMWSWVQVSKESFPKVNGDIKFMKNKRTCILPVVLEPNKTYAIWVNSGKYNAFRDISNNSSVPYLIVFKTGIKTKK